MYKLFFVIVACSLAACSVTDDGSKFEGKWSCTALGANQTATIRNNGGNNYIIESSLYPAGGIATTYKDGVLSGPMGTSFSVDKQSGKLLGMNICQMDRVK